MIPESTTLSLVRDQVLITKHRLFGTAHVSVRVDTPERVVLDEGIVTSEPFVSYFLPPTPHALRFWYSIAGVVGAEFKISVDVTQETNTHVELVGMVPESGVEERLLVLVDANGANYRLYWIPRPPEDIPETRPFQGDSRQVWFATNRRRVERDGALIGFSAERDSGNVHYGLCHVQIPKTHAIGSRGRSLWRLFRREKLSVTDIRSMAAPIYFDEISQVLSRHSLDERHAVVFIHGYNVSFEDAAISCGQLGADLDLPGITAFFSWPSRGSLRGYLEDEASVDAAEKPITNYLIDLVTRSGATHAHVIAHSMGNRALLRAVERIARNAETATAVRFRQVVLAAPDVDQDTFRQVCSAYSEVADRVTLYVSGRDRAVEASRWLHGFPRVGLDPPLLTASGIDTVRVTDVDVTLLGHGYVSECRPVISDMFALLRHSHPPEKRFGLRLATAVNGAQFWELRA